MAVVLALSSGWQALYPGVINVAVFTEFRLTSSDHPKTALSQVTLNPITLLDFNPYHYHPLKYLS